MQTRKQNKILKKKINPWKWAFIVLLALILATGAFIWLKVTMPSNDQIQIQKSATQLIKAQQTADIDVSMNKEQLNAAINYYLAKKEKKGIKYRFLLDKSAILMGTTKILGKDVSFTLYTQPKLDKEGNIMLKAKSVAIGSLNAPPSFILGYIKGNYDLGQGVRINTKKETITLDLNKLVEKQGLTVKGQELNLNKDKFLFKVSIPLE